MLPAGLHLARRSLRIVRQNLVWTAAYNLLAIPLAMAEWITPWMAGIGMSASSLLVVLNALRLQRARAIRMEILYQLIPLSLVLVFVIAVIFWRSLKGSQFDDLEGSGYRVLMDDDSPVAGEKIGSVDLDQRKTPSDQ